LIFENKLADFGWELTTLPLALAPACEIPIWFRGRGTNRTNRIGRPSQVVRGDVGDRRCLPGGIGSEAWRPDQVAGGSVGMTSRGSSLGHGCPPLRPCPDLLDCETGSRISGACRLKEVNGGARRRLPPRAQ
jgi:hypothetical protein